jgi:hypothetical protein
MYKSSISSLAKHERLELHIRVTMVLKQRGGPDGSFELAMGKQRT